MYSDFNGFPTLAPNLVDFRMRLGRYGALRSFGNAPGNLAASVSWPTVTAYPTYNDAAVDIQTAHVAAVTHGVYSFTAGAVNKPTGEGSVAIGIDNNIPGNLGFGLGVQNNSSGFAAFCLGQSCTAVGNNSMAFGYGAVTRLTGQQTSVYGGFDSTLGNWNTSSYYLMAKTTDATPTDAAINLTSSEISIANDTTCTFEVLVTARRTDANDFSASYMFIGCLDRNANAASTAAVGLFTKLFEVEDDATWDCNVTADTTNGGIKVTVTGAVGMTIRWGIHVRTVEVTG